jgi:hypothetical protein
MPWQECSKMDEKLRNELWCADYKGEFMLADRRYCYQLTITDPASRHLLCCEALSSTGASLALTVFERIFKDFGLPHAIRTDNGVLVGHCESADRHVGTHRSKEGRRTL